MRKGSVPATVLLPFVFGVLITLVIFFTFIFPSLLRVLYGACWGNLDSQMTDLASTFARMNVDGEEQRQITLGDCIGKMVFANRNRINSVLPDVTCDPGYRSAIIVTPGFEGIDKMIANNIKRVDTKCREIPYKSRYAYIEEGAVVLDGPEGDEDSKTYCLTIKKTATDTFSLSRKEGEC